MLGAIIGDIVGSRFEWSNFRSKNFTLFQPNCFLTDDSIMTLAIGKALLECKGDYTELSEKAVYFMQKMGRCYPDGGYGGMFGRWLQSDDPKPYNSFGNGAAMRVSPCSFFAKSLDECKLLSQKVTEVTHNHPEGLKAAEAVSLAGFMALEGRKMEEIREYVTTNYYQIDFTLDEIRPYYAFSEACQDSVPQALQAFFESTSFEDAIRNAISIGGDSDTIAAICGGTAEAYYGVPAQLREQALEYMDQRQLGILIEIEEALGR